MSSSAGQGRCSPRNHRRDGRCFVTLGGLIESSRRFQPQQASPGQARRFVAATLADWDRPLEVETVVLLTSEVVSNVVLHAGPHRPTDEIVLCVAVTDDRVRVSVTDQHPGMPRSDAAAVPDGLSGRGLLLLDVLASAWGVVPDGTGKVVWFEVQD